MTPASIPIRNALDMLTKAHGAVMGTNPAKPPLRVMLRSGLPDMNHIASMALIDAVAAAMLVVAAMWPMEPQSRAMVEPGLNPNQPNQSTKTPMVADVRLWPGIGLTFPALLYLPMRGPRIHIPDRAAHPPIECTMVEPAKS